MANHLYYGDNLSVLRNVIGDERVIDRFSAL
jgi:hypothetical protein